MLRDLNKVFGLGRTKAFKAASLYLAELPNAGKDRFRTHQVSIVRGDRQFEPELMGPFCCAAVECAVTDAHTRGNPFPGLRRFTKEEADLFFGRDKQSDELLRRLAGKRFLAVVGTLLILVD